MYSDSFTLARLCYTNRSRGRDDSSEQEYDMMIDLDILTSPQSHSLEYTLFKEATSQYCSKLPVMARIMVKSKELRVFRLVCEPESRFHFEDYFGHYERFHTDRVGFNNLSRSVCTLEDQMESLKKLVCLSDPQRAETFYDFDNSHCNAWRYCMHWSKLFTFDLGGQ